MKRTTFNAIGGWQPFLFCIGMYVVALFFSIFVLLLIFRRQAFCKDSLPFF